MAGGLDLMIWGLVNGGDGVDLRVLVADLDGCVDLGFTKYKIMEESSKFLYDIKPKT